ncbi:MAG: formyltransferase family protein [Candidatus Methanoperedens sp.]|nr:formyltransferase family protein [Candidatus Methanoperedens sp.]
MNIIIFTVESEYSYILLRDLINQKPKEIKGIFVSKPIKYKKLIKFIKRKVVSGLGVKYYLARLIRGFKQNQTESTVRELAKKNEIPIYYTADINAASCIFQVQNYKPDVIISAYFDQIIKSGLLTIPTFGIINIHSSLLPKYRGVKPTFWVLRNNETVTGVTLHLVDNGLDTGDIIDQKEIPIYSTDSMDTLQKRIMVGGSQLLINCIDNIKNNSCVLKKQNDTEASYYSQPTKEDLKQFIRLGKKFW